MRSCSIPESLACEWEQKTTASRQPPRVDPQQPRQLTEAASNPRHLSNSPIKSRNCRTDLCNVKYGRMEVQLKEALDVIRQVSHYLFITT